MTRSAFGGAPLMAGTSCDSGCNRYWVDDSGGMPVWWVTEPILNLWVADKPVSYQPSRGPEIAFRLMMKNEMSPTEIEESHSSSLFSIGANWHTPWRSYLVDFQSGVYDFYNGMGGRTRLTNTGNPSFRGQMTVSTSNSIPIVSYANGARDVFGVFTNDSSLTVRYFLTARTDPSGNTTYFDYDTSGSTVLLTNITDVDSRHTKFSYTNINGFSMVATVTNPFNLVVTLRYDAPTNSSMPHLTNITDAIGISSGLQYDSEGNLSKLITPYATNAFLGMASADVTANKAIWIKERGVNSGIRNHLYLYSDHGNTNLMTNSLAAWRPSTTNGGEFSIANTFDATNSHTHNSFYWNPVQFGLLPTNFVGDLTNGLPYLDELQATNILQARMKHWLIRSDSGTNVVCTTISLERNPSPDGTTPGQITWYDYENKSGGDATREGRMMLPSFVAQKLPNGEANFTYALRNSLGHPTNVIETWNNAAGDLKVRTNILTYAGNNIDLLTITNAAGIQILSNVYNADHLVTTNLDALNQATKFTYDGSQRLTSVTTPAGLVTTNIYGGDGYLFQTIDVGFRTNSYVWSNALVCIHTNELGLVITNAWDALNRLIKVTHPDGTYVTNTYSLLDLTSTIDRMGFTNRYDYNDFRQILHSIDALNHTNTYGYCDCGELTSITDPLTNTTTYSYDLSGRLLCTLYPDGYSVSNNFDLLGRITNVVDSGGSSVTNWFNNQGLMYASSNYFGQMLAFAFDIIDRVTTYTDANAVSTVTSYDNLDRVRTRTFTDSGVEQFGYSQIGLVHYTNELGNATHYGRDAALRKTYETNANQEVTQFTYDAAGNLLTLTDGKSQVTSWNYDKYGLVTNKVDNTSTVVLRYKYDANLRLTNRYSIAKGDTYYAYDKAGNLTNVSYPVSPSISLAYDALNRPTNMIDAAGTTKYGYNTAGQLLSEDGPWSGDAVSYSYANRLRSEMSLAQPNASAWSQSYGYDAARRLTNTTSPAGSFGYAYDGTAQMLVKKLTQPSGAYITNTFDGNARLLSTVLKNSGNSILNSHAYSYNVGNQRTDQTFTAGNYVNYEYDPIGQLTNAVGKESGGVTNRLQEQLAYGYDAAHNLSARTNNGLLQTFGVNSLNELTTITRSGTFTVAGTTTSSATGVTVNGNSATLYSDKTFARASISLTSGDNTFTAIGGDALGRSDTNAVTAFLPATNTFVYDSNGNMTSDGKRGFDYDDENQLIRITATNSWKSEFTYDGKMRMRIRKEFTWNGAWVQNQEVHYIYDGNLVIQERDQNNTPRVSYTRGIDVSGTLQAAGGIGGLLARTDNSVIFVDPSTAHAYYHADGNGNITALLNSCQGIDAKYLYDPFGNTLSTSGPKAAENIYRFSSKEYHRASGLVYYLFRFYVPTAQRWLNRDPIEEHGGWNLYSFVNNSPIKFHDKCGLAAATDTDEITCLLNALVTRNNALYNRLGKAFAKDGMYHIIFVVGGIGCAAFKLWPYVVGFGILEVGTISHTFHESGNMQREAEERFYLDCLHCAQKYGDTLQAWFQFFNDHRQPGIQTPRLPPRKPVDPDYYEHLLLR